MTALFKNRYRIETARWRKWNYGWNGKYFITIVTKFRKHYFGKIINGEMICSAIGEYAEKCWREIPDHFPFVVLDEFQIMPNHIHGIIIIDKINDDNGDDDSGFDGNNMGMQNSRVETQNFASLRNQNKNQNQPTQNKFGPQSQNLGSIIRGFKIGVTKFTNQNNFDFGWQSRYHDHVIRNEESLNRIRYYIRNNPKNWINDKFNL